MSRRVIGYDNGKPLWSDNIPSEVIRHGPVGGELIRGAPGPNDPEYVKALRVARKQRERERA